MKLSYCDRLNQVLSVTKTKQDNDVIGHIGVVFAKNDIVLSWLIESSAVCDENLKRQQHDWSYKSGQY